MERWNPTAHLNLSDGQVEESHPFADFKGRLRDTTHTHGCTETTVELQDNNFLKDRTIKTLGELGVGHNELLGWRVNLVPNAAYVL